MSMALPIISRLLGLRLRPTTDSIQKTRNAEWRIAKLRRSINSLRAEAKALNSVRREEDEQPDA